MPEGRDLFRSQPFVVNRVALARAAAEAYVRQFWWFILPGPLFGLIVLIFAQEPYEQAFAALLAIWPATIPFRAYVITAPLARRLSKPTTMVATDEALLFSNEGSKFMIEYAALRHATIRHGMVVIRTRRFDALILPFSAFADEAEQQEFLNLLQEHGVRTGGKAFLEV